MRIISGTVRGRQLASFSGDEIRPTPDRVREALFSKLTSLLGSFSGIRVLELFAGSGAQSLEALSRGAAAALMIDSGRLAAKTIRENIARCHFEERARLFTQDCYKALPQLTEAFDLILLDPPYNKGHLSRSLPLIADLNLLGDDGIICAESGRDEETICPAALKLFDSRVYGTTRVDFFQLAAPGAERRG